MKAIIEAKKYRDTDSSYIVVEIRFFVFLYSIIKSNGLVSQFLRKHLYFLLL